MKKYHNFYLEIFPFLVVKFSIYLNRRVFVMGIFIDRRANRAGLLIYSFGFLRMEDYSISSLRTFHICRDVGL